MSPSFPKFIVTDSFTQAHAKRLTLQALHVTPVTLAAMELACVGVCTGVCQRDRVCERERERDRERERERSQRDRHSNCGHTAHLVLTTNITYHGHHGQEG